MGPKNPKSSPSEDIIEALLDQRVVDSLCSALGTKISDIVEQSLGDRFKDLLESMSVLKSENAKSAKTIVNLEAENKKLRTQLDDLDAYSKCENLIFQGLPPSSFSEAVAIGGDTSSGDRRGGTTAGGSQSIESSSESEKCVLDFVNNVLHVPLSLTDISLAHRLPKRRTDSHHAPLIVRFTNLRARNAVYAAKKTLASHKPAVYINEHLTKDRATLFHQARDLMKRKMIQGAWTHNGSVFIKLSNLPDSRPIRVNCVADLPRG